MIKKGSIIRCNRRGLYYITSEQTLCVALNDAEGRYDDNLVVMVIEDNRFGGTGGKAVGRVYSVDPFYFDVVQYVDENSTQKDRIIKTAMKLCKKEFNLSNMDRYATIKQMSVDREYPISSSNMTMRWGYMTDNGQKLNILEFELSSRPNGMKKIKHLVSHQINCDDIDISSYRGGLGNLRGVKEKLEREGIAINSTVLYENNEHDEETIELDNDLLRLLDELTLL